ncbi:MAG TPA: NAD(P)-dependent oxidoreductase [Usitatibacter sp.]|nr:NAD(P)-dependent oxidoreductase [Usitatibacter sp.]
MRVLVTGASGFIGKNVLLGLPAGASAVATYHRDAGFPAWLRGNGLASVEPLRVDLADTAAVAALDGRLKSFDACVYLAANGDPAYSAHAPVEDLRANALATLNTVTHMRFGHFVYFSSGAVYDGLRGDVGPASALAPTLPYAISKYAAERYVMHARKEGHVGKASVVRFFGAYGPYEASRKIYGRLVRQFAFERSPRFTIRGDGRNLIDAMYVEDTVRAVNLILARARDTRTFDLYSGAPLTLKDLVTTAADTFGLQAQVELSGAVPEYIEFRSVDRTMRDEFGFEPAVALRDGLQRFERWMTLQPKEMPCPQ